MVLPAASASEFVLMYQQLRQYLYFRARQHTSAYVRVRQHMSANLVGHEHHFAVAQGLLRVRAVRGPAGKASTFSTSKASVLVLRYFLY